MPKRLRTSSPPAGNSLARLPPWQTNGPPSTCACPRGALTTGAAWARPVPPQGCGPAPLRGMGLAPRVLLLAACLAAAVRPGAAIIGSTAFGLREGDTSDVTDPVRPQIQAPRHRVPFGGGRLHARKPCATAQRGPLRALRHTQERPAAPPPPARLPPCAPCGAPCAQGLSAGCAPSFASPESPSRPPFPAVRLRGRRLHPPAGVPV